MKDPTCRGCMIRGQAHKPTCSATVFGIQFAVDPAVPPGKAYIVGFDEDGNIKTAVVIQGTA